MFFAIFSVPVQMYTKSYSFTLGIGFGISLDVGSGGGDISKILNLYDKVLCDGIGTVRQAVLYADRC